MPGLGDTQHVFVSLTNPNKPVIAGTIAEILRSSIKDAGLGSDYSSRSFRPTGATAAVLGGVDPHTAGNTCTCIGRWKSEEVFFKRYLHPLSAQSTTQRIFSVKL
ncbi:hypothetical protein RRG08_047590 [Elysia crispata]|uniref:Uncharacterized protein n=1 Tax=Elysia crispata TaxID=231223 RepID=A0AAE0XNQ4_9GAST|nr:hypothetical protein RRG08_047590 [Elysia crispata]